MHKIEYAHPADLQPYEVNNKRHGEEQVQKIADSIREFGFTQPIVVGKFDVIIIGHGRHAAAQKLGLGSVPIIRLDIPEKDERKLRLLDNKLGDMGEYDNEAILAELEDLKNEDLWKLFSTLLGGKEGDFGDLEDQFELSDEDRAETGNMTFIVSSAQKETINHALNLANTQLAKEGIQTKENGTAAELIAKTFLKAAL